jgi:hypothetical protein
MTDRLISYPVLIYYHTYIAVLGVPHGRQGLIPLPFQIYDYTHYMLCGKSARSQAQQLIDILILQKRMQKCFHILRPREKA